MNRTIKLTVILLVGLLFFQNSLFSQSFDAPFSKKNMYKDLTVFKQIREKANSGLYKYRTKRQIDSIYNWAYNQVEKSTTYGEFYNIISQLTDYEGSLHNGTWLSNKVYKSLNTETGYFPLQVKVITNKLIVNAKGSKIPLGSEILTINTNNIADVIENFNKYYTTDGYIIAPKRFSLTRKFNKYYRMHYGKQKTFAISYREHNANQIKKIVIDGISYKASKENFKKRYSKNYDSISYKDLKVKEMYTFKKLDKNTSVLSFHSFDFGGNEDTKEYKEFVMFLDSVFATLKKDNTKNLIVDVRHNGGGSDPNEVVTYEYLTKRNFSENKSAWISFKKIPYLRYVDTKVPRFLRPIGVIKYNKMFQKAFPIEKDGKFYEGDDNYDHKIRKPHKNAFQGKIYLLIGSETASAGSNFASLLANDENTTIIGEETCGGYFGHNGHTPLSYILPKSKIKTFFSVVNLLQYVEQRKGQIYGRGILPDYYVTQSYEDFIKHKDTQMEFTLKLIQQK